MSRNPAKAKGKLPHTPADDTLFRVRAGVSQGDSGGVEFTFDRYPTYQAAVKAAKPDKRRTTIMDIEQLKSHTWILLRRWLPDQGWRIIHKEAL